METPLVIVGADKKSPASVIQGLFHDHAGLVLVRESKAGDRIIGGIEYRKLQGDQYIKFHGCSEREICKELEEDD